MANRVRQRTVREGQLERTLEGFNQEMSLKVAESMSEFRRKYQQPTEERLDTAIEAVADMAAELEKARGEREALGARIDQLMADLASTRRILGEQGATLGYLRGLALDTVDSLSYLQLPWYIRLWRNTKSFFYQEAP
jgi:hypothetical protein